MVKLGLCKYRYDHHANPRPRWDTLVWATDSFNWLRQLDNLAKEKDCLRLLMEIFDEELAEKIVTGTAG